MTEKTPIASLFDDRIYTAEMEPLLDRSRVYEQEWSLVEKAVPKRQAEFIAGRICARILLAKLGIDQFPLLSNEDRSPRWPQGIIGSISHTVRYCAAAVTRLGDIVGIGLDIEQDEPLKDELIPRICTPGEMLWLSRHPIDEQRKLAKLIFSAKECAYKCKQPLSDRFVGFQEAEIEINLEASKFYVTIHKELARNLAQPMCIPGRFTWHRSHVMCGATLLREDVVFTQS